MIWLTVSSKGVCESYIHRNNGSINADVYLNQCVKSKLIPFIKKHHTNDDIIFWPDLARAHYSKEVLIYFDEASVPIIPKTTNPPKVAQGRPIEDFRGVLVQLIREHNLEAKTTKQLERRIRKILKKINITLLQSMMENVRKNFRKMYTEGVFSICH